MIPGPEILSHFEQCPRAGFFARQWALQRMTSSRMTLEAIKYALTAEEAPPWGEVAGSEMMELAEHRGLDTPLLTRIYDSVLHHASLADIIVTALRKDNDPPWYPGPILDNWTSSCLMSPEGDYLRRIVLVSHWNEERKLSELRSWYTLGEVCHFRIPMQLIVAIIGSQRDGKRTSHWTTGLLHMRHSELRFRKRIAPRIQGFKDSWIRVHREDYDSISREKWLNAMLADDVLPELLLRIDVPVPDTAERKRVVEMAVRKFEILQRMRWKPDQNLSSCDDPPCQFKRCCHSRPEKEPSEANGFLLVDEIQKAQSVL